ncbi:nucleotidyltransferase family protein [Methanospirillum stamsii]|uniref:nucleotidyltransferase family protein n=1 Tax=Methanospirillum stamsii TaxID=1277351 RepID=UPI001C63D591|nr:nucleotidyltransferase domain-containing protein [Methanospirillum stamsii]
MIHFTTITHEIVEALNIRICGSVARKEETPDSDIDLLVDMNEDASLLDLARLKKRSRRSDRKKRHHYKTCTSSYVSGFDSERSNPAIKREIHPVDTIDLTGKSDINSG